jgi:hypothetical protein
MFTRVVLVLLLVVLTELPTAVPGAVLVVRGESSDYFAHTGTAMFQKQPEQEP